MRRLAVVATSSFMHGEAMLFTRHTRRRHFLESCFLSVGSVGGVFHECMVSFSPFSHLPPFLTQISEHRHTSSEHCVGYCTNGARAALGEVGVATGTFCVENGAVVGSAKASQTFVMLGIVEDATDVCLTDHTTIRTILSPLSRISVSTCAHSRVQGGLRRSKRGGARGTKAMHVRCINACLHNHSHAWSTVPAQLSCCGK